MRFVVKAVCSCFGLQHPEHDLLYLEDAFCSHHISHDTLLALIDVCLQDLPSGGPSSLPP